MNEFLKLRDCNGQWVFVSESETMMGLARADFRLFGASPNTILEFVNQYKARGGRMPITAEAVIEVFGVKKGE